MYVHDPNGDWWIECLKAEGKWVVACREAGIRAARESRTIEPPSPYVPRESSSYEAYEIQLAAYKAERGRLGLDAN